ncbi:MAG: flagellar type III secretion system protein FliR [Bacteroidetes bacterium]|nr:flagellar type III secretion system protein FliR [Bacteroidota bacterium]
MELAVQQFLLFILIFIRATSLFISAPMYSHNSIPMQAKIGMGLFLAFVMMTVAKPPEGIITMNLAGLVILGLKEVLTGASIGFAMQVIFSGVRFAGELISFDMGFSMSTIFDPENGTSFPVISEILYLFLLMIFLMVNGHHFVFEAVYYSYSAVPIGEWNITEATMISVASLTGKMFAVAVKLSAPLLVSLFLANITLGILNKVMPQMNIFSVMFSLKISIGFFVLIATIPVIAFVFKKLLTSFQSNIVELIKVM